MNNLKNKIKKTYTDIVLTKDKTDCCDSNSNAVSNCCGANIESGGMSEDYSHQPGYDTNADYGLGCGIPVAFADITSGDAVLDLGSGAGNDVFVARSLVGEKGKVIGVDMTPAMVEKANENKQKLGYENVEFILGDIEDLPIPKNTIDVVVSNCVLNLVSDKLKAYQEVHKVLKSTGHFSISDIVVSDNLIDKIKKVAELYTGCIAGAMIKDEYLANIKKAGFQNVVIRKEKTVYLPDTFLNQYLTQEEVIAFRSTGVQILSITVNGEK